MGIGEDNSDTIRPMMFRGKDIGGRETNYILKDVRGKDETTGQQLYSADRRIVGGQHTWKGLNVTVEDVGEVQGEGFAHTPPGKTHAVRQGLGFTYAVQGKIYAIRLTPSEIEDVCSKDDRIRHAWQEAKQTAAFGAFEQ